MSDNNDLQAPPHSIAAEQSTLGAVLIDSEKIQSIASFLKTPDFYNKYHQLIFSAFFSLSDKGVAIDIITVSEFLKQSGEFHPMGWLTFVGMLARDTVSSANIEHYAKVVKERSIQRQLMALGGDLYHTANNPNGKTIEEIISEFSLRLQSVDSLVVSDNSRHIKTVLAEMVDEIEENFERGSAITGLSTGFIDLDNATGGLRDKDLIIVAGRSSMGKTTLAMNIGENAAIKTNLPVLVFSLEMPDKDIAYRATASMGKINLKNLIAGQLQDDDWARLTSAINILAGTQLYLDDTAALSIPEMKERARKLAVEKGALKLVIIDHIDKIKPTSNRAKHEQVGEITNAAKEMAKELGCPVILLSQLNRELEKRPNKRPIMSDLRNSGSIEQDADLIVFVYRDEVYNEDSPDKGIAELIIGKNRNGPLSTVRLAFLGQFTRFENFAGTQYDSRDYE